MSGAEFIQTFDSLSEDEKKIQIAHDAMARAAFMSIANDAQMTCDSDSEISHQIANVATGVVRETFIAMNAIYGEVGIEMFSTLLRAVVTQTIEELENKA